MDGCYNIFRFVSEALRPLLQTKCPLGTESLCLSSAIFLIVSAIPALGEVTKSKEVKEGSRGGNSFERWQAETPLDGKNGPRDDADADGYANLVEFAFGLTADSGFQQGFDSLPRLVYNPQTAKFDFEYRRRADLPKNLSITLMLTGFQGYEERSSLVPAVTQTQDGFETVVYANLESDPVCQSQTQGKARLLVCLSSEHGGTVDAQTPFWCWRRQIFQAGGSRSFAMPLVRPEIYRGRVAAVTPSSLDIANVLSAGEDFVSALDRAESYYVEVMDGDWEGQRWEVDEPACSAGEIALDLTSQKNTHDTVPDLSGVIIAVRPHQTLSSVIRMDRLLAATQSSQADRVQFWERAENRYTECWLSLREGNQRRWVSVGDSTHADSGRRVVQPGEGMSVKLGSVSASVPLVGLVRDSDLILSIDKGTSFLGTGWTEAASPGQLDMKNRQGFCAGTRSPQADRLRVWNNQSKVASTLSGYYLRVVTGAESQWVMEGDTEMMDHNDTSLLNGFEAFFLIHPGAFTQWRQPAQLFQGMDFQ